MEELKELEVGQLQLLQWLTAQPGVTTRLGLSRRASSSRANSEQIANFKQDMKWTSDEFIKVNVGRDEEEVVGWN